MSADERFYAGTIRGCLLVATVVTATTVLTVALMYLVWQDLTR